MNISSVYGKKVISTAGKGGYVISVNAADDKICCLVCADEDEKEFYIDVRNIISIEDKILFEDRLEQFRRAAPIRLGRAGFDDKGKFLGCVEDFAFSKGKLLRAKIGKKSYAVDRLTYGDVVIVKGKKKLMQDVIKDGRILIKKGTEINDEVLALAQKEGEYVQTNLKSI